MYRRLNCSTNSTYITTFSVGGYDFSYADKPGILNGIDAIYNYLIDQLATDIPLDVYIDNRDRIVVEAQVDLSDDERADLRYEIAQILNPVFRSPEVQAKLGLQTRTVEKWLDKQNKANKRTNRNNKIKDIVASMFNQLDTYCESEGYPTDNSEDDPIHVLLEDILMYISETDDISRSMPNYQGIQAYVQMFEWLLNNGYITLTSLKNGARDFNKQYPGANLRV